MSRRWVTSITDALGQVTAFAYDPQGNLTTITDPLGSRTALGCNSFGQPVSMTDALGNTTRFEYDTVGNLVATVDPLGNRDHARVRPGVPSRQSNRPPQQSDRICL